MSVVPHFLSRNGAISFLFLHLKLELLFPILTLIWVWPFSVLRCFQSAKCLEMEKKEVTGTWLPVRQEQRAAPSLDGCCHGHILPKHEVFKGGGWNLQNRLSIPEVQPQSSLILQGECSQKTTLIPSWTLLWKTSKILRGVSERRPKHLCFVNRKSLCLERIFSPFNSCMQPFYITPFCSILGLKSSFPSHEHRGECSCHPDIL